MPKLSDFNQTDISIEAPQGVTKLSQFKPAEIQIERAPDALEAGLRGAAQGVLFNLPMSW